MAVGVVYTVIPEGDNSELRYALRALEANGIGVSWVLVIGHRPEWLNGCEIIETKYQPKNNHIDVAKKMLIACEKNEPFVFFHDDIFIMKPTEMQSLPTFHLGFWKDHLNMQSGFGNRLRETASKIGIASSSPMMEMTHHPLAVNDVEAMKKAAELCIEKYPLQIKSAYGHFARQTNWQNVANCKRKNTNNIDSFQFLSTSPESWEGDLGKYIRNQFKQKSKFEK